jgi:cyclic pyranopterin phosphate synthase
MVTAAEVLEKLARRWTLTPVPRADGAPAEMVLLDGGPARVGIVSSVTRPFCGSCNRLRLTADGQLRNCLFALDETDIRTPLRRGVADAAIAAAIRSAVASKRFGHGIDDPRFVQPSRPMSAIGG